VGCGTGGAQETWLRNDLAAHTQACTLALFHEPLYTSSSEITPNTAIQPLWQDLYNFNVDLVVNGHGHNYERFAPQDANGSLDTAKGIIEIVVGTGGVEHAPFNATIAPNSLVRNAATFGILKLTLHQSSFDWQFVPVAGQTFNDSGTQACHLARHASGADLAFGSTLFPSTLAIPSTQHLAELHLLEVGGEERSLGRAISVRTRR